MSGFLLYKMQALYGAGVFERFRKKGGDVN